MNKQKLRYYNLYNNSTTYSIYEAYKNPSTAKLNAWNKLLAIPNIWNLKILCHSCQYFTVGYQLLDKPNKLYIETNCKVYEINI